MDSLCLVSRRNPVAQPRRRKRSTAVDPSAFGGELSPMVSGRLRDRFHRPITGKPLNVYTIHSDGSDLQAMPGPEWKIAPSWSADGKSIAFALDAHKRYLALYDLETRKTSILSNDKTFLPIFSPDGRYIVGATTRPPRLRLFDFRARKWRDLMRKYPIAGPGP